jgi:hypothetical protein
MTKRFKPSPDRFAVHRLPYALRKIESYLTKHIAVSWSGTKVSYCFRLDVVALEHDT